MPKVTGPLMSMGASGQLNKTIVFSIWRGRPYVRTWVKPNNPQTGPQTGNRAMVSFLSERWATIAAGPQATWATLAQAAQYSNFNAYTSANMLRWSQFESPGLAYPIDEVDTAGVVSLEAAVGGVNQVQLDWTMSAGPANDGCIIFRGLSAGFARDKAAVIAVVQAAPSSTPTYIDTPLVPDEYFYRIQPFTGDGVKGTESTEISATST